MAKKNRKRAGKQSASASATKAGGRPAKRRYLKQLDVPSASLDEALRIPEAILDHYAGKPTAPLYVAKALNVDPKGSQFQLLSGAAVAFGLVEGGSQAAAIEVTELGKKILRPKEEGSDHEARRNSVLMPRVFGEFLRKYDEHALPREDIGQNVLEDMGVPRGSTLEVLGRLEATATAVGLIEEIKGKRYVSLRESGATPAASVEPRTGEVDIETPHTPPEDPVRNTEPPDPPPVVVSRVGSTELAVAIEGDVRRRRVFITHGKNRALVEPIKKILEYGELEPVTSVEKQSVSKPVPEKVEDDMRACGAAIIHVDADKQIVDGSGKEHVFLNPNVLIEIGAAMAFYGRRFILLVREGVRLPSNLQGLFEVRYDGETLDPDATLRLLEAIKDIKNHGLPGDVAEDDS